MARRYHAATWRPLGPQTQPPMRSHDLICVHTMVGSLTGTDAYFRDGGYGGTESHFGTGGNGERPFQWQDLAFTADANLDGNHRVISIENADHGPGFGAWTGSDVPRFTTTQADQLVDLIAWLCSPDAHSGCPPTWTCRQVGIPAAFVADSKPGRRGIAVHRQGVDGNFPAPPSIYAGRVPGGERWSTSPGKVCPGDKRIRQLVTEIIPAVQARLEEDIMPTAAEIADAVWNKELTVDGTPVRAGRVLVKSLLTAQRTRDLTKALRAAGVTVDETIVEQALRNVFADAATPD